jgi:hypothetical protein
MRLIRLLVTAAVLCAAQVVCAESRAPAAAPHGFEAEPFTSVEIADWTTAPGSAVASPLALATGTFAARPMSGDANKTKGGPHLQGLTSERAQALLRSLTIPGWGQASLGHKTSAMVFGVVEAGVWTTFAAYKIQQSMRTESYLKTAELFAGIDLSGHSEEYRRMVGSYPTSEDYNRFVVYRDAANLYYDNPTAYNQYIAEHSVGGANGWAWASPESYERYQEQRKEVQRAGQNANVVLAVAVANRLLSALHAARIAGKPANTHGLRLDFTPNPSDPSGYAFALRTSF